MGTRGEWYGHFVCACCKFEEAGPLSWCGEEPPEGWVWGRYLLAGPSGLTDIEEILCKSCIKLVAEASASALETYTKVINGEL
jgi:hypothetical protein